MRWIYSRRQKRLKKHAIVRVLFVCRVNHCRSPMAEGVFGWKLAAAGLADRIYVDSAGVEASMIGQPPDPRAQVVAARHGVDIGAIRSRQVETEDFEFFDYILAMDRRVYDTLLETAPGPEQRRRVGLLGRYITDQRLRDIDDGDSIPDPYYGGSSGFDRVMEMLQQSAEGLLQSLQGRHSL